MSELDKIEQERRSRDASVESEKKIAEYQLTTAGTGSVSMTEPLTYFKTTANDYRQKFLALEQEHILCPQK